MKRLNDEFQQKTKEMDTKTEDMKNTIHEKDQTISHQSLHLLFSS